jgi:hypothetical protein
MRELWLSQVSLTNGQNDPLRYNWLRQQPIETEEGRMEYSTLEPWQEISETGVVYDLGSLYDRFRQIKDPRKAHGKRYSLVTLLGVIFLAKLCNQDTPVAIADWAQNHAVELAELLQLKRTWMPHHNTIRRVFQTILAVADFERMVREYHQQQAGGGEQWAIDGKTLRGTRIPDVAPAQHVLSVYDVQTQRVVAQEVVETKENEIVAAPQALQQVRVEGKIITGDAMHAQQAISAGRRLPVGGQGKSRALVPRH